MKNICVDCEKEINQNNSRGINCHRKILLEFANTIGKTEILKDYNNSRERLKMDSNHILLNIDSQLFKLEKLKIEIDKYPSIPAYLEIEGSKKEIENLLKRLGYKLSQTTNMNATSVLKYYNVNPNFQKF